MRIQLPARIRSLEAKRPGLVPIVGVGAGIVAAYAGIAALRRGAGGPPRPAGFPGLGDLSSPGLGLDSGPPPPTGVAPVSPGGGGYDPLLPPSHLPRPPIITPAPAPAPTAPATIGGSRGAPAPTGYGAPTTSQLATLPGTPTPAGHVSVSFGGWGTPEAQAAHQHPPARHAPPPAPVTFGGWGSAAAQAAHRHAASRQAAHSYTATKSYSPAPIVGAARRAL